MKRRETLLDIFTIRQFRYLAMWSFFLPALLSGLLAVTPLSAATVRVSGGTFRTASHIKGANLMIESEASLSGTGTIHSPTTVRGMVDPGSGNPVGTLMFGDSLAFENGHFLCDVASSNSLDNLSASGKVSGMATVIVTQASGAYPGQEVLISGAPDSEYSQFDVQPLPGWELGTSGSLDLWASAVPVMEILGTNEVPVDSGSVPSTASGTTFDYTANGDSITHTMTVSNNGAAPLNINWTSSGADPAQFSITGIAATLAVGASDTFTVEYHPDSAGAHSASLSLASDDPAAPFVLNVGGNSYELSSNSGPAPGGNEVTITNGLLGSGSDITTVTVGGVPATITGQGATWVSILLPPSAVGDADITIESTSEGSTTLVSSYTYNPYENISAITLEEGDIHLNIIGVPAQTYDVEACTNLTEAEWQNIGQTTMDSEGQTTFTDSSTPEIRFYRVVRPE